LPESSVGWLLKKNGTKIVGGSQGGFLRYVKFFKIYNGDLYLYYIYCDSQNIKPIKF
jgi:hypothetical protein